MVRLLAIVCVVTLVVQAGVTMLRVKTGYYTPFFSVIFDQDVDQIQKYLSVDRSDPDLMVRGYGTLGSPGGTVRLCMLMFPFALFLCVPNTMFKRRLAFVA